MIKAVFFDLDGTLIDTSPGIFDGIDYMLEKMNLPELDIETKNKFVGPSLSEAYSRYLNLSGERLERAIKYYRSYCVKEGYKHFRHYPGTKEMLKTLRENNILCVVVTMKKQSVAHLTLDAAGLSEFFDRIIGNDDLIPVSKADLIKKALRAFDLDPSEAVLVGDTDIDGEGAQEALVDYFPALYGFGYSVTDFNPDYPFNTTLSEPLDLVNLLQEERR